MKKYEAPFAKDLSAFLLKGQVAPEGLCASGTYPYGSCAAGPEYIASCTEGSTADTSRCTEGSIHSIPYCRSGSYAITGCTSGSHQN